MTKLYLPVQISRSKGITQSKSASSVVGYGNELPHLGRSLKTPIRRFFFKFEALKYSASGIGSKRSRVDERGNDAGSTMDSLVHSPPLSSDVATSPMIKLDTPYTRQHTYDDAFPRQQCTSPVPCMSLQNSDHSVDAIVISTLFKLPFCCHEDLLTMSPARVVEVAQEMNERLPEVFKIDLKESYDHNSVRREVERLVGIVKSTNGAAIPGAPLKRVKSKGRRELRDVEFLGHSDFRAISPPTSPLASISERRDRRQLEKGNFKPAMSLTKLTMQQEEEDDLDETRKHVTRMPFHGIAGINVDEDIFRVVKKRRTSVSPATIKTTIPTTYHIKVPLMLTRTCDDINDASEVPSRIRDLSLRKMIFDDSSSAAALQSGKVIIKTSVIDRSLANTRPRYRLSSKFPHAQIALKGDFFDGPLRTPTPKFTQMERQSRLAPIQKARYRKQRNFKGISPDWSPEANKQKNRSAYGRMDCMLSGVSSLLESDGNKAFY